jgi:hypothetical protein
MVKSNKYRTYKGYARKITPFTVFLIHGKEATLYRKIQNFIETELRFLRQLF